MRNFLLLFLMGSFVITAQNYPPAAGQTGSTAIPANSELFLSWATGITLERGYVNISNPDFEHNGSNKASYGVPNDALGPATNNVVSLGDAGEAILTFATPITDGPGFDFAVFENSFSDTYLELAFVEVSSDGINFFRFPGHSQTQTTVQIDGFGDLDPTYIHNLAGKYRGLFGTPFDLSDLQENPLLDKSNITHVKIIDVVGSIDPQYAGYDSYGNIINDPFPTPFYTSGFDLDAVGVINERQLGVGDVNSFELVVFPNPTAAIVFVHSQSPISVILYDISGKELKAFYNSDNKEGFSVSEFADGIYLLKVIEQEKVSLHRIVIKK